MFIQRTTVDEYETSLTELNAGELEGAPPRTCLTSLPATPPSTPPHPPPARPVGRSDEEVLIVSQCGCSLTPQSSISL